MDVKLYESFTNVVKGRNFMTPQVIEYIKIKGGVVELSTGDKFLGTKPYGVTVVKDNKHDHDLSKCFWSIEEANEYINSLK